MKVAPIWQKNENFMGLFFLLEKADVPFYLVGGIVRESLQNLQSISGDYDLTTPLSPREVKEKLKNIRDIFVLDQAEQFGTLNLIYKKKTYELTSFRKDMKTDGRYAEVSFTKKMEEDAKRRDFTCNALYADEKGLFYDPTGEGRDDLLAGRIRFIGNAKVRIQEDYLRILRLFRFQALLGRRPLPQSYERLIQKFSSNIQKLSKERRWKEFSKLLAAPRAYEILCTMYRWGVMKDIFQGCGTPYSMRHFFDKGFGEIFPIMVLIFLDIEEEEVPLSKNEKRKYQQYKYFRNLLRTKPKKQTFLEMSEVFLKKEVHALILLFVKKKLTEKKIKRLLNIKDNKEFLVTAKILQEKIPIQPGPKLGKLLQKSKKEWLRRHGFMTLQECMSYINPEWIKG